MKRNDFQKNPTIFWEKMDDPSLVHKRVESTTSWSRNYFVILFHLFLDFLGVTESSKKWHARRQRSLKRVNDVKCSAVNKSPIIFLPPFSPHISIHRPNGINHKRVKTKFVTLDYIVKLFLGWMSVQNGDTFNFLKFPKGKRNRVRNSP